MGRVANEKQPTLAIMRREPRFIADRYATTQDLPEAMARSLRDALLKVRDGARVFSGSYAPTPSVPGFSDRLITAALAQGLHGLLSMKSP